MKTNYYTIELPVELLDGMDDNAVLDLAVMQVQENTRKYFMPCNWVLCGIDRETGQVKIKRIHD